MSKKVSNKPPPIGVRQPKSPPAPPPYRVVHEGYFQGSVQSDARAEANTNPCHVSDALTSDQETVFLAKQRACEHLLVGTQVNETRLKCKLLGDKACKASWCPEEKKVKEITRPQVHFGCYHNITIKVPNSWSGERIKDYLAKIEDIYNQQEGELKRKNVIEELNSRVKLKYPFKIMFDDHDGFIEVRVFDVTLEESDSIFNYISKIGIKYAEEFCILPMIYHESETKCMR